MFLWVSKSRRGELVFSHCGGWRFDEYRRDPPAVADLDWSTVPRGRPVVLTHTRRATYLEREPGVFEATWARTGFASTVEKATRGAHSCARFAFADDERAVDELVQYVRRERASKALVRQVIAID